MRTAFNEMVTLAIYGFGRVVLMESIRHGFILNYNYRVAIPLLVPEVFIFPRHNLL